MYPDVPFVDRDDELCYLFKTRDEAETRVHVICGQSGIGKSELARKFSKSCEDDGYPTLFYPMGDPRNEKVFLQRLLAAWFEKHPESMATQIREYIVSPDSVDDLLGVIRRASPDPSSSLAIEGLRNAISGVAGADVDFPDPVQLITDVMKRRGSSESPAVVVIDQYDTGDRDEETGLESTFRDIANRLDDSVVWYVTANTEIRGGEHIECYHLGPFDQEAPANPGASYPEDMGQFRPPERKSDRGYAATRALVEETGLEYEESDLVDLHDRTKGVPLLVASICEAPETFSLGEELENLPTNFTEFTNQIQEDFIRGLADEQRKILEKTSVVPIITEHICHKRTGIPRLKVRQNLSKLGEQGKLMQLPPVYPVSPAFKCHDFHREFLIECADLEERELRLETAIDCLEIAFENVHFDRSPEITDLVALQLERFLYQVSHVSDNRTFSEIADLIVKGSGKSESEIGELLTHYLGYGHRNYSLEDYLREEV